MTGGRVTAAQRAALDAGRARGLAQRKAALAEGLAHARAWRARMAPVFDAIYPDTAPCRTCGRRAHD